MEKRNRNNTFKVTKTTAYSGQFFFYKHFPYCSIYTINYMQTTTSNHPTIQMNGCKSHCIKIKNGINRRLHLFTYLKVQTMLNHRYLLN